MVPGMGKIENTFDGLKLGRQYEDNGTVTGTDYCGPFVYETVSGGTFLEIYCDTTWEGHKKRQFVDPGV